MEPHRSLLDRDIEHPVHDIFLAFIEMTFEISFRKAAVIISVLITTGTIFCYRAHAMRQMLCCRTNYSGHGQRWYFRPDLACQHGHNISTDSVLLGLPACRPPDPSWAASGHRLKHLESVDCLGGIPKILLMATFMFGIT